jgi:hypothetical protein
VLAYNPIAAGAEDATALPKYQSDVVRSEPDWHTLYEIENPPAVDAYVGEFPALGPILAEAPRQLARSFRGDLRLTLRTEVDPEEEEMARPYLVVDILMSHDADDALERLYDFEDTWWLDAMPRDGAIIVFMPH